MLYLIYLDRKKNCQIQLLLHPLQGPPFAKLADTVYSFLFTLLNFTVIRVTQQ